MIANTTTNQGVFESLNGARLQAATPATMTNLSAGTLTGGTWRLFAPFETLAVTAFDVQRGATQRSYVRYLDVTFNQAGDVLQELLSRPVQKIRHRISQAPAHSPLALAIVADIPTCDTQVNRLREPSMCLGIPGQVMTIYREHELLMGKIRFGSVTKQACLEHLPESEVGDYVLVHVGFALAKIDEAEANRVFAFLEAMQELDELRVPDTASGTQSGDT